MTYFLLKYIHIISATILFGTGIGSAFYMFMANRKKDLAGICFATKNVVLADFLFTTPAVLIQPLSGIALAWEAGYDFSAFWLKGSLILYFITVFCWLPVVGLQLKMRDMALHALKNHARLPKRYWIMDKWWVGLGCLALVAMLLIFYLMISRPEV